MSNNRLYANVINADNTTRTLLVHSGKKKSNNLLLNKTEFEKLKHINEKATDVASEPKVEQSQNYDNDIILPKRGEHVKQDNTHAENKPKEKNFYYGEVTNHLPNDENYKTELDAQLDRENKYRKAVDADNRGFDEMLEKDTKSFLTYMKRTNDKKRELNKKYEKDLIKKIEENALIKEKDLSKLGKVPVEMYVLSKKESAQKLNEEYKKYLKDMLEMRGKEYDLVAVNKALTELKKFEEIENAKLDEIAEHIDDKPQKTNNYKAALKQKQRLDAIMTCARNKNIAEQKRSQWEDKNERAINSNPPVNTDFLKKIAEMEQEKEDKGKREKWFNEQKNNEKKMDDYYKMMEDISYGVATCDEKEKRLKKRCGDVKYRKSLERQMKEQEFRRKKKIHTYEMNNGNKFGGKMYSKVRSEDLPEYLWKSQVWTGNSGGVGKIVT